MKMDMWTGMCIMDLQILFKLFKSEVRVWFAKILKAGHGLFKNQDQRDGHKKIIWT